MSIRRRVEYKYKELRYFLEAIVLPDWMTGTGVRIFVLGAAVLVGVFYLTKINSLAATGYEMRDLENKVSGLTNENQKLEVKIAEWSSLKSVQNRLSDTEMVAATGIKYVSWGESAVAMKK